MISLSENAIDALLAEDCPYMDVTVEALGMGNAPGRLECHPKADCVLAGADTAARLLQRAGCRVELGAANGTCLEAGQVFLRAGGTARALHKGWKVAQNVLEYACGIATRTARMLEAARREAPHVHVGATRKNFPGAKGLSIAAVLAGGGSVHRLGLSDSLLVFEQHRVFMGGMEGFVRRLPAIRRAFPERKLCAEVDTVEDALALARAGIDSIQCERFSPEELALAARGIRAVAPQTLILAAGGVNADNAAAYARAGADVLVSSWMYFGRPQDIKVRITPL